MFLLQVFIRTIGHLIQQVDTGLRNHRRVLCLRFLIGHSLVGSGTGFFIGLLGFVTKSLVARDAA